MVGFLLWKSKQVNTKRKAKHKFSQAKERQHNPGSSETKTFYSMENASARDWGFWANSRCSCISHTTNKMFSETNLRPHFVSTKKSGNIINRPNYSSWQREMNLISYARLLADKKFQLAHLEQCCFSVHFTKHLNCPRCLLEFKKHSNGTIGLIAVARDTKFRTKEFQHGVF